MTGVDLTGMRLPRGNMLTGNDVYVLQSQGPTWSWRFPAHQHDGWSELQYVVEGTLHQEVNGRNEDLSAGDLVLVRRDDEHALHGRGFLLFNLLIPDAEWQRLEQYLGDASLIAAIAASPRLPRLHLTGSERARMANEMKRLFGAQRTPEARSLLARLLLSVLPRMVGADPLATHATSAPAGAPAWLGQLLLDLDHLIDQGTDPAQLAQRARVSPEHLARCVRRHLGMTPTALLNRRRLDRAALLLSHTDRPVLGIALDLGFGSASAFSRAFRQHHRSSPRAWRQRYGVGEEA